MVTVKAYVNVYLGNNEVWRAIHPSEQLALERSNSVAIDRLVARAVKIEFQASEEAAAALEKVWRSDRPQEPPRFSVIWRDQYFIEHRADGDWYVAGYGTPWGEYFSSLADAEEFARRLEAKS